MPLKRLSHLALMVSISGCATSPYQLGDTDQIAAMGPRNPSVIRSLRCEITTFLVENKLRSQLWFSQQTALKRLRKLILIVISP